MLSATKPVLPVTKQTRPRPSWAGEEGEEEEETEEACCLPPVAFSVAPYASASAARRGCASPPPLPPLRRDMAVFEYEKEDVQAGLAGCTSSLVPCSVFAQ